MMGIQIGTIISTTTNIVRTKAPNTETWSQWLMDGGALRRQGVRAPMNGQRGGPYVV